MFGKKILSIIGLLFLGASVRAVGLETCGSECDAATYSATNPNELCIDGNEIFKAISTGDHCKKDTTVVKEITGSELVVLNGIEIVDLTDPTTDLSGMTANDVSIYQCTKGSTAATCTQTVGYIFDSTDYCKIDNSANACDTIASIASSTSNGVISSSGSLYVNSGEVAKGEGRAYLLTGDASSPFGTTKCIVKATANAFAKVVVDTSTNYLVDDAGTLKVYAGSDLNTAVSNDSLNESDYCFDKITAALTSRSNNYCDPANNCDNYYTFNYKGSGVWAETTAAIDVRQSNTPVVESCNPATNPANCTPGGYYIVSNADALLDTANSGNDNKLYHCSGTAGSATCTEDKTTVGYLVNADNGKENAPYIVCKATTTTVNRGDGTLVTKNECDAIKPDGTAGVGKLIEEGGEKKLCIDGSNKIVVGTASSYLVDAMTASTFVPSEKVPQAGTYYVLVNMDSNGNVILNAQEKIKYRYAHTGSGDDTKTRRVYEKASRDSSMCSGNSLNGTNAKEYVLNYTDGDKVDFYKASA